MITFDKDADGIVLLTMDDPNGSANVMNAAYVASMGATVDRLEAERESITGVVIASAKKTFFAGGDLTTLIQAQPENAAEVFAEVETVKAQLRRIEKLGVPTVAAINGAALGGGLEIALAMRHRIAAPGRFEVGLPEVMLGLLPGGGGVTRTVRMLGVSDALQKVLLQGQRMQPAKAQSVGLIDEILPEGTDQAGLIAAAKAWITANLDNDSAKAQPWDQKGYKMPGGTPSHPSLAQMLPAFPAGLAKQLKGAKYPAPEAIMSAAVEGAQVDFDSASRIESRYFTSLTTGRVSKAMIQAFFFDLQEINSGKLRPEGVAKWKPTKVVVLGAGMMGAGIAYVLAKAGVEVVLKDVAIESAEKGKAYSQAINDKAIARGRLTQEKSDELLARITPSADPADAKGCDCVIEAVFEDPSLKAKVFAEVLPFLEPGALLCSNTSTLPITGLAKGLENADDAARFVGLHFFSPVDKMPLVEIIRGAETDDESTARAIDITMLIKKTPIVVNDSRGFYTSRVIGTFINEGLALLGEGVAPYSLDRAGTMAGFPVGVLQLSDELNLELMGKIRKASKEALEAEGHAWVDHPGFDVVDKMLAAGRAGKLRGAGFYEYADGKRGSIWAGLADLFPLAAEQPSIQEIQDRLLFPMPLETVKCFDEGVLDSTSEANIGSIFGIGMPANTGGTITFINNYEGGLAGFVARANELADKYGERFRPSQTLVDLAAKGESFTA
jgi:3-hydroxyacyl-CoA dehydrogenase/enoyl-CoA hydratase/3-hydroxybutyryl-CoA epimerase